MSHTSRRAGIPSGAIILIIIGVVLLLNTLGLLPWRLWGVLWRFWPLVLIVIGVNILLGRARPWLALGVSLVLLLLAVGASAYYAGPGRDRPMVGSFSEPLAGAESARVDVSLGAGSLLLDSLPADSDQLATGEAPTGTGLTAQAVRVGNRVTLEVEGRPSVWWAGGEGDETWRLHLSQRLPIELELKTGASNATIDLSRLRVGQLNVNIGASRASLTMPATGHTEATIKAGAASLDIVVPQGVAARIRTEVGLASMDIDQSRFPRSGDFHMSPGYETAANRIDLTVSAGAASVNIR